MQKRHWIHCRIRVTDIYAYIGTNFTLGNGISENRKKSTSKARRVIQVSHRSLIFSLCLNFLYAWLNYRIFPDFFSLFNKRTFRAKEWLSDLTHIFVFIRWPWKQNGCFKCTFDWDKPKKWMRHLFLKGCVVVKCVFFLML